MDQPRSVKSKQTRKKIFDAAARLIKEHGEEYLTIANICEEAGISKGTFFYHFNSKDDLLTYYLRDGFDDYILARKDIVLKETDDIYEHIMELYGSYLTYCEEAGIEFVSNYYTPKNKALDMSMSMGSYETMNILMRESIDGFRKAIANGYIREGWSPETLAYDCCSLAKGCVFEWCLHDGGFDLPAHTAHMMHTYFAGFVTDTYRDAFPFAEPPMV